MSLRGIGKALAGGATSTWIGIHAVAQQHPTHRWYDDVLYGAFAAGMGILVVSSRWVRDRVRRGPVIRSVGVSEFHRSAQGSRNGADLQVVFGKVRNHRDGGGELASLKDAEVWMEAFDGCGRSVARCQGNWLELTAGQPDPEPVKSVTLRPTGAEWGVEIAAKFIWAANAWLAGAATPTLEPGRYTVNASISDGSHKATVFRWSLTNPGAGQPLRIDGANERRLSPIAAPSPGTAVIAASASTHSTSGSERDELRRFQQDEHAGRLSQAQSLPEVTHDLTTDSEATLAAQRKGAMRSAHRDIVGQGRKLYQEFERLLAGSDQQASAELVSEANAWLDRCVLWASDADLRPKERSAFKGPFDQPATTADYYQRIRTTLGLLSFY